MQKEIIKFCRKQNIHLFNRMFISENKNIPYGQFVRYIFEKNYYGLENAIIIAKNDLLKDQNFNPIEYFKT